VKQEDGGHVEISGKDDAIETGDDDDVIER
jgi:hypothetical protein